MRPLATGLIVSVPTKGRFAKADTELLSRFGHIVT